MLSGRQSRLLTSVGREWKKLSTVSVKIQTKKKSQNGKETEEKKKHHLLICFCRLKTGDLPPPDIEFEEMQLQRQKKSSSLTRRLSRASFSQKKGKQNLFQTKRNILKNIEKHQVEIAKGIYLVYNLVFNC